MASRQQLERILKIDELIRAGKYPNPRQLAQEFGVQERTIYLDRQFMVDRLGAPIAYDRRRGGWYYTDPNWALPTVFVTEGELLAFLLSVEVAKRYLGTPFEKPLLSAVEKIRRSLKGQVEINLAELQAVSFLTSPSSVAVNERLLFELQRAIVENRRVKINYFTASRGSWQERVVEPYHLFNLRGDWYLVAFDHFRQAMRVFHTGRIDRWQVLSEVFVRDPHFSLQEWMKQAFIAERGEEPVEVVVRFDAYQARYIRERCWHPTQRIEELPDGGLILRFTTGGLEEVKRWVMGYGSHVEVLAPASLRRAVKEELKRTLALYEEKNDEENF